jgi:hypothetical protein
MRMIVYLDRAQEAWVTRAFQGSLRAVVSEDCLDDLQEFSGSHLLVGRWKEGVEVEGMHDGMRRVTEAVLRARPDRVTWISSIKVYGQAQQGATELDEPCPDTVYGAVLKWGEERMAREVPTQIVRFAEWGDEHISWIKDRHPGLLPPPMEERHQWIGEGLAADAVRWIWSTPHRVANITTPPMAVRDALDCLGRPRISFGGTLEPCLDIRTCLKGPYWGSEEDVRVLFRQIRKRVA